MQINKMKNEVMLFNDEDKLVGVVKKINNDINDSESVRRQIENYDIVYYNDEKYEGSSKSISFSSEDAKVKKLTK